MSPWDDVDMKMGHRLSCGRAIVDADVVPIGAELCLDRLSGGFNGLYQRRALLRGRVEQGSGSWRIVTSSA